MTTALAETANAQSAALVTRAAQEVQAAMVIAKKFPRDEEAARNRINKACSRPGLAERAEYEYPRGGENVSGPSIRLAEAIAQCWGNMEAGVVELGQANGESQVMAYAWDFESNTRETKIFTVPHLRYTRNGSKKLGDDPRDVYELVANMAARRKRACILAVIPGDVVDEAMRACDRTLAKANGDKPLAERVAAALKALEEYKVTPEMVAAKFGCNISALSERQLGQLGRIYNALRDGIGKVEGFFDVAKPDGATSSEATGMFDQADTGAPVDQSQPANGGAAKPTEPPASKKPEPPAEAAGGSAPADSSEAGAPAASETKADPVDQPSVQHADLAARLEADEIPVLVFLSYAADSGFVSKDARRLADVKIDDVQRILTGWNAVSKMLKQRLGAKSEAAAKKRGK